MLLLRTRSRSPFVLGCLVALLGVGVSAPVSAVRAPDAESSSPVLPNFDARYAAPQRLQGAVALRSGVKLENLIAAPPADPGAVRRAALLELSRTAGPLEARWDDVTGSPRLLFARHGALAPPDPRPHATIARDFLMAHRALFLLDASQAKALAASLHREIPTSAGGTVVHFEQSIGGIDVLHGHLEVGVAGDGRVLAVMGGAVSGAGRWPAAGASAPAPASSPARALRAMASLAGVELAKDPVPAASGAGETFRVVGLRSSDGPDIRVRRTMIPTSGGPRAGWMTRAFVAGSPAGYELVVDDATLQPVRRASLTWFLDTRGRVHVNSPSTSPYDLVRFPDTADFRRDQSPLGWTDESLNPEITSGNNALVQDDVANDDEATPGVRGQAAAGASWLFDHPFTDGGAADQQASLTSLFHGINWSHDLFYDIGFDERSGNFQADNVGRGGVGGDAVAGDDMDGSGTNNANFATVPDGQVSRMQMYLWDISGTSRSSSFETGIVIHEYAHGVSTRLVGGPGDVTCLDNLQGAAMGEAWSDYFAGSFLDAVVVGEWVSGSPDGIRMYRLDENPATGKDYRDFCTYANDRAPRFCEPHDNGEMWSGFLWLVREDYVAAYGPVDGARRMDQLVMDAMKYTPCNPSMLDARDALVLADRLQTGGVNECVIKTRAAQRYMGSDASSQGGNDGAPAATSTPWPECVDAGVVRFDREGLDAGGAGASYSCQDSVGVTLTDGTYAPTPDSVTVVVLRAAVEVDRETVTPAASSGPGVFVATLPTTTLVGAPFDGLLQVQDGDVLEARYADAAPVGSSVAQAGIACSPRLQIVRHHVLRGSCDDDTVPGYDLPGFVDSGETADVEVEIASLMSSALAGTITVTTDRPDLVTVLPSGPIAVSFPAAVGSSPASLVLPLKVVGSTTIAAGDVATLAFTLRATAFPSPAAPLTLPLELNMDYSVESALTYAFDVEGETAPVGPGWSRGELVPGGNDQWTVVGCANTTPAGTQSFRNGPASCVGRYSDNQGNPWLATPPMTLFAADTRAARVTDVEWQNDVDLGVIGFPPNVPLAIDADAVAVVLSNDPAVFDASDPLTIATTALALYIHIDVPGFFSQNSNTTGFVLDQRPIAPGQITGVDLAQPVRLTWYFLPDISFVQPGLDMQGEGYYLDDVKLTYERVKAVPQASACTPTAAVYSAPVVADPALGAACAGALVHVDASRSESALCGPPAILEYRFLDAGIGGSGAPVACLQADGVTPRVQDAQGWGTDDHCYDVPMADVTYAVEVRCQAQPAATDARSVTVRIIDGLPILTGSDRAFCVGSGLALVLDASQSSLVGCPGAPEYAFSTAAGPADCDLDGTPDGFRPDPTCTVGPSDVPLDVTVSVQCSALPGCALTDTLTVPAVSVTSDLREASVAPGGFYCPGALATLDAGASAVTGCSGGQPQYRFTSSLGFDSGWVTSPTLDVPITADESFSAEVRCSLSASCIPAPAAPVAMLVRTGAFSFGDFASAQDCAGELFQLRGSVQSPPGARCAGTIEYRFVQQTAPGPPPTLVPVACFDDAAGTTPRTEDAGGFGASGTCFTAHVAGGADFVMQARCSDDPGCVLLTSNPRPVTPQTGVPVGSARGTLRVRKTGGCPGGGNVNLAWSDTDYNPLAFVALRSDDPTVDLVAERLANVNDFVYTDAGVACDGGGAPYRTAVVYFYQVLPRNTCTDSPIPDP